MNVISSETFGNSIVCSTASYKEINKTPQYWPFVTGTTETDGLSSQMPVMRKTSPSCWRHLAITRTNADLLITHKAIYLAEFYAKFQFFHSRKNMKKIVSNISAIFVQASIYSLWPSDAMWRYRSGSTLAQVMARCLAAPIHYLHHYWLLSGEILCSPESNFTVSGQANIRYNEFEMYTLRNYLPHLLDANVSANVFPHWPIKLSLSFLSMSRSS